MAIPLQLQKILAEIQQPMCFMMELDEKDLPRAYVVVVIDGDSAQKFQRGEMIINVRPAILLPDAGAVMAFQFDIINENKGSSHAIKTTTYLDPAQVPDIDIAWEIARQDLLPIVFFNIENKDSLLLDKAIRTPPKIKREIGDWIRRATEFNARIEPENMDFNLAVEAMREYMTTAGGAMG